MSASEEIGTVRDASELKRGDHVRLADGRWGLLLGAPVADAIWKGRLSASVTIEMRHSEGVSWRADQKVYSRSPEEQVRHVETVFATLRKGTPDGGAA